MIAGPILYAIAGGLLFTIDEHTSNAKIIGYQILAGFGEGLAFNQPSTWFTTKVTLMLMPLSSCRHPSRIRISARAHPTGFIPGHLYAVAWGSLWHIVSTPRVQIECVSKYASSNRIAGAVFGNQLGQGLAAYSGIIPEEAINGVKQSVTVIFLLPPFLQSIVVTAYVKAIDYVFIVVVPAAGITIISALFVKNWNLKERGVKPGASVA